jgi:hypothetical protein
MFELPMQSSFRRSLLTRKSKAEIMSEVPVSSEEFQIQQTEQTLSEDEEEGVPMSRRAHLGTGLFLTVFGGIFGGGPLAVLVGIVMSGEDPITPLALGVFFSPFILIGGGLFILGMVTLGAGIIGYPLIKEYDDEDEEEEDGGPVSTAFAYTSEDDMVEQIRETQVQPALAEPGERAPTLGWGIAPASTPTTSGKETTSEEKSPATNASETDGGGAFWSGMASGDKN